MRPVHMKVRLRYFTFLLKHVAVCKFDPYIVELWLWKSIWLSGFSFCFSLEFAYVTAVVRVIAREMFFFQAANMLHGCLVHVAGSFHRLQIVRSLFYSAGTPRFYVWSLGITVMPCSQDKREGRGAQGPCSIPHGDLQVCTAAGLLGHSDRSCLCFPYSSPHSTLFYSSHAPTLEGTLSEKIQSEWTEFY